VSRGSIHGNGQGVSFSQLLRTNRNFRRIWFGEVASWLGDWFSAIAVYTLVQRLTGSPFALGLVFLTKMAPFAVASPLAGLLVDRFDRRRLMIAADLVRAVLVLGFLWVDDAGDLYLVYVLTTLQVFLTAVFIPARSASIPNVTTRRELLTANALSAATWSTILAVGAALGGFATEWLGVRAVFVIDSATYVISAIFLVRTVIPQTTEAGSGRGLGAVFRDTVDGWRHMRANPNIGRMAFAKATWALGGGALVYMLAIMGEEVVSGAPAVGIGVLYTARGLGTGIGPLAVRKWLPNELLWPLLLGIGVVASGVSYMTVGAISWGVWILILVVFAHAPSGANWVASSVLLQKRTVDRYRGRVFATEWLLVTLADSLSILTASLLMEAGVLTLRSGILLYGGIQVVCGLAWIGLVVPKERLAESSA
jgi:MFS family permease